MGSTDDGLGAWAPSLVRFGLVEAFIAVAPVDVCKFLLVPEVLLAATCSGESVPESSAAESKSLHARAWDRRKNLRMMRFA